MNIARRYLLFVATLCLFVGCASGGTDYLALEKECEKHFPDKERINYAGPCPIRCYRLIKYENELDSPFWNVMIQNVSHNKLKLAGLCTTLPNQHYIDPQQPGAFQMVLYPGQEAQVFESPRALNCGNDWKEVKTKLPQEIYVIIQDYVEVP